MEIRHLRYFVAVAEELHFGRAAARLNICQPPLSRQIMDLEEELGVKLFNRKNKKISLTEAGSAFLADSTAILRSVESAGERARNVAQGLIGRIVIGFVLPAMDTFLPDAIREFGSGNPGIEIQLREMGTIGQLEALSAGSIDLGIVRLFQQNTSGLVVKKISEEPYILALPAEHPLTVLQSVPLNELHEESLILFPRKSHPALYDRIIAGCSAVGCTPKISQEASTKVTAIALVSAGMGVALVPASATKQRREGVAYRSVTGSALPMVELSLAWREEDESACLHNFIRMIPGIGEAG